MTAAKTTMSAESHNDLKDQEFPKKANGRIGDGSTERHAAQALGGSEPSVTHAAIYTKGCEQSEAGILLLKQPPWPADQN